MLGTQEATSAPNAKSRLDLGAQEVAGTTASAPNSGNRHYAGAVTLRIRIDLSYDGTSFSGWAAQPGRRTVEDTLSDALTTILRSPTPVRLVVAGRTDAGVHARGQVCHADVDPAGWEKVRSRSGRPLALAVNPDKVGREYNVMTEGANHGSTTGRHRT